jgi:hypothetical protein
MELILLIISVAVNILLAFLVFFRSALNDIIKEWWLEKRKTRKESKDRLVALRSNLVKLSNSSSLLLILTATNEIETDPVMRQQMKPQWGSAAKSYGEIREAIIRDEALLPNDLRQGWKEFEAEMQKAGKEVLNSLMYKERLLEITQNVTSKITSIIENVDKHLS